MGLFFPIYEEIKFMFQTTSQLQYVPRGVMHHDASTSQIQVWHWSCYVPECWLGWLRSAIMVVTTSWWIMTWIVGIYRQWNQPGGSTDSRFRACFNIATPEIFRTGEEKPLQNQRFRCKHSYCSKFDTSRIPIGSWCSHSTFANTTFWFCPYRPLRWGVPLTLLVSMKNTLASEKPDVTEESEEVRR